MGRKTFLWAAAAWPIIACLPIMGQPLRIEQVLSLATSRAESEDTRVPLLEANAKLLESMNRRRFEFRPNLGLFSFSNPAILAATLGSGLTYQNKRVAPQTLEASAHDLLSARIARERAKVRAQIDAARTFFRLVEKQELEKARCDSASMRQRQKEQIQTSLQSGALTALDYVSFQSVAIDSELTCTEARTERKLAALRMASILGRDEPLSEPAAVPEFKLADYKQPIPSENAFHETALKFREDIKWVDRELAAARRTAPKSNVASVLSAVPGSVDYRYYTHTAGSRTPDFLLGGHTAHLQLPWSIPLTKTTEKDAEQLLAAARLRALESEAAIQRRELHQELNALMVEAESARERIELVRRKREAMRESRELLAARVSAGLAGDAVLFAASLEAAERDSEISLKLADQNWRAALYSLYVACGIHEKPELAFELTNKPAGAEVIAAGGGK